MKRALFAVVACYVAMTLWEPVEAAPRRERGRTTAKWRNRSPSSYRARPRRRTRRPRTRTVVRQVGVSLPQLRSELSRLESGLASRVQKIEKVVARPPARLPVKKAPPPPPVKVPPARPPDRGTPGATLLWPALTGLLGFGLGRRWPARRRPATVEKTAGEGVAAAAGAGGERWSQLRERLEETQRRLAAARARIRRLERGT